MWGTVYHYFRSWKNAGVWTCLQKAIYDLVRTQAGRAACPSVVIITPENDSNLCRARHEFDHAEFWIMPSCSL